MEEKLSPMAATHLLQHALRSLCSHGGSRWVYAVFWRILPRNFPPPKWDLRAAGGGGAVDRSRGNRRNWILAWEDGFCDFAASSSVPAGNTAGNSSSGGLLPGLQPELFFKMSHEIYSYGEGMVGKVAADYSHRWVFKAGDRQDRPEANLLKSWQNPADSQPRTWEAQFQSGIKTIALIAVTEGVVQLGAVTEVMEDPSYVVQLRKQFSYLESIPGVLLPHPLSSSAAPLKIEGGAAAPYPTLPPLPPMELLHIGHQGPSIAAAAGSLEALLSALPPVGPSSSQLLPGAYLETAPAAFRPEEMAAELMGADSTAEQEVEEGAYAAGLETAAGMGGSYYDRCSRESGRRY